MDLVQKIAEILQMTVDKVTEMYPTLVQEATWYTVVQNTRLLIGAVIPVSLTISILVAIMAKPAYTYERDNAERRRQFLVKVFKVEAIVGGILGILFAIATIFGPFLYPNINLFMHLFK